MKHLKSIESFSVTESSNTEINESIESYYFNKSNFKGFDLPGKGETLYAVISHNKVEINKEQIHLKLQSDNVIGSSFKPVVLFVLKDEASAKSAYDLEVKKGGSGANLSFSFGTIGSKGSNVPYEQIEGIIKTLK